MLAAADPGTDKPVSRRVITQPPYAREKGNFLGEIVEAMRGRAVLSKQKGADGEYQHSVYLFGYASDLERAEMLWTSLLVQATYALEAEDVEVPWYVDNGAAYRRTFNRAWTLGFYDAACGRIRKHEKRAEEGAVAATGGMELVLVSRAQVAERLRAEKFPGLKRARFQVSSSAGFAAGKAAGNNADIGVAKLGRDGAPALPGGR
jgi:hypothetical protein